MASNLFSRFTPPSGTARSFYEELRAHDETGDDGDGSRDLEEGNGLNVDEENLRHQFHGLGAEGLNPGDSRMTVDSATVYGADQLGKATREHPVRSGNAGHWFPHEEDPDNDVPESLLVEPNEAATARRTDDERSDRPSPTRNPHTANRSGRSQMLWDAATAQQRLHREDGYRRAPAQPRRSGPAAFAGGRRERALWRWVNTSNLDSFMRDVYDYYEGGGLLCILCANALWLLSVPRLKNSSE